VKLGELIERLEQMKNSAGADAEVLICGDYASEGDAVDVEYKTIKRYDCRKDTHYNVNEVYILSDICSG